MRSFLFKYFVNFKKLKFFEFLKLKFLILKIYYINIKKLKVKNKIKLFCVETGRSRAVNFFFLLNRMNLKKNFNDGLLNGLKKIS